MSWRDADTPPPGPDGWRTLGWTCAVVACAGLLSMPALPGTDPTPYGHFDAGDFFRPQWWVLATFAAYPLFFAARSSWRVALPLAALVIAQMGYVVHQALAQMAVAGVAAGADRLWYGAWVVQSLAMLLAAGAGGRISLRNRRWERRMRKLVGRDVSFSLGPADRPGSHEGFYTAG